MKDCDVLAGKDSRASEQALVAWVAAAEVRGKSLAYWAFGELASFGVVGKAFLVALVGAPFEAWAGVSFAA